MTDTRTGDREWYARLRFRPDFRFEVGRTKAELELQLDITYGQSGACAAGPAKATLPAAGSLCPGEKTGATSSSSLNTDVGEVVKVEWAYTEFDLTGADALLPFIPVQTVARAGLQPFETVATYRLTYAFGSFPGVSAITRWAPNATTQLAYVVIEDELGTARHQIPMIPALGHDYAWIVSEESTLFTGFELKPMYSYFHADGTTSAAARRPAINRRTVGGNVAGAAAYASATGLHEDRHTLGASARWRSGPWALDPVVLYQTGTRETQAMTRHGVGVAQAGVSAWLVDVVAARGLGPWLLEVRTIYSTGNEARDNLSRGIRYFEPLDTNNSYAAGWGEILSLSAIGDYILGTLSNAGMSSNVGYDRYGRAQLLTRVTYAISPTLSLSARVNPTWTAEKVDTDTGVASVSVGHRTIISDRSFVKGDSHYIGTEADLGLVWRFSPNTEFGLAGGWLFAGPALDTLEIRNGAPTKAHARDAWVVSSRIRLLF